MSIRTLEDQVKRRVEEATKGVQLIDNDGNYVEPLIVTGALPSEAIKGRPYILIQTLKISDDDLESRVEIGILYSTVGMSRDEESSRHIGVLKDAYSRGHWDILGVIEKIRLNFLKEANFEFGVLDRKMQHEVFGNVNFKFYMGESRVKFRIPTIAPENDYV